MVTSTNLKLASFRGLCRDTDRVNHDLHLPMLGAFFMPKVAGTIGAYFLHYLKGRSGGHLTKVKQPTGFIRAISSKMIKKPKRHLLNHTLSGALMGFVPNLKGQAGRLAHDTSGFIKRGCFL